MDTIAAIATPTGAGGIGIVRISGDEAAEVAARVFRRGKKGRPVDLRMVASHRLLHGFVVDPQTEERIDAWNAFGRALCGGFLAFAEASPGPRGATTRATSPRS